MTEERWLAVLLGITTVLIGAGAGWLGYSIGAMPPREIIIHIESAKP